MADLRVDLGFLKLRNPVLTASGTFGYGPEFAPFWICPAIGGIVVKGLYYGPREGNPPPRLVETAAGLINAIGLQGVGVEHFAADVLPELREHRHGRHRQRLRRRRRRISPGHRIPRPPGRHRRL